MEQKGWVVGAPSSGYVHAPLPAAASPPKPERLPLMPQVALQERQQHSLDWPKGAGPTAGDGTWRHEAMAGHFL